MSDQFRYFFDPRLLGSLPRLCSFVAICTGKQNELSDLPDLFASWQSPSASFAVLLWIASFADSNRPCLALDSVPQFGTFMIHPFRISEVVQSRSCWVRFPFKLRGLHCLRPLPQRCAYFWFVSYRCQGQQGGQSGQNKGKNNNGGNGKGKRSSRSRSPSPGRKAPRQDK